MARYHDNFMDAEFCQQAALPLLGADTQRCRACVAKSRFKYGVAEIFDNEGIALIVCFDKIEPKQALPALHCDTLPSINSLLEPMP